jgi:transcriptional regulator with XRE-family HTH domain
MGDLVMGLAVLEALKRHGMKYGDLAKKLGVTHSTISHWLHGRHAMPRPVQKDLEELVSLVAEGVGQGRAALEVLADWQPTVILTRQKGPSGLQVVETSGPIPFPPDLQEAEAAIDRHDVAAHDRIQLQAALRNLHQFTEQDVSRFTMEDIARLRRATLALEHTIRNIYFSVEIGLYQPTGEGNDA